MAVLKMALGALNYERGREFEDGKWLTELEMAVSAAS